jgi:hypothetical protein
VEEGAAFVDEELSFVDEELSFAEELVVVSGEELVDDVSFVSLEDLLSLLPLFLAVPFLA